MRGEAGTSIRVLQEGNEEPQGAEVASAEEVKMARAGFRIDTLFDQSISAGAANEMLLSLMTNVSATQSRRGWTMVRTIIGMDLAYSVHDSGEGSHMVDAGIAVASQEAFAAGTVADPSVHTDHPLHGWVFRARHRIFGFAADQPMVYSARVDRDLRAKRKLDNGEMFIVVQSTLVEGAVSAVRATGLVRQYWLDM